MFYMSNFLAGMAGDSRYAVGSMKRNLSPVRANVMALTVDEFTQFSNPPSIILTQRNFVYFGTYSKRRNPTTGGKDKRCQHSPRVS